ncbi:MAG: electron transport complex subunit RsxA [Spirochaetaceae bacterium]
MNSVVQLVTIAFSAFLIQNIILTQFLGLCSFFGVGNKEESALGMGLAVTFVITLSSIATYALYIFVLVPFKLEFLSTISFILVVSGLVQFVEMVIKKYVPGLYKSLGVYLPLITTNCAVLGVALLNIDKINPDATMGMNFLMMLLFSFFTASGYAFVIYLFSLIREQIAKTPIHPGLKGVPIALITAFVMAMGFNGFVGMF